MIKILFFDIDGTLLEFGKKEMHPELIDALNLVKQKGIKIILATEDLLLSFLNFMASNLMEYFPLMDLIVSHLTN